MKYKATLYKKFIEVIEADSIDEAEVIAQKKLKSLCSKDNEFEPATGMLHSIRIEK